MIIVRQTKACSSLVSGLQQKIQAIKEWEDSIKMRGLQDRSSKSQECSESSPLEGEEWKKTQACLLASLVISFIMGAWKYLAENNIQDIQLLYLGSGIYILIWMLLKIRREEIRLAKHL